METINERVQIIVNKYYNGNVTAFSRVVGTTQSTIRDIVSGKKNKPSGETIQKILSVKNLNINPEWLLTGSGETVKKSDVLPEMPSDRGGDEKEIKIAMLQERIDELKKEVTALTRQNAVLDYLAEKKLRQTEN